MTLRLKINLIVGALTLLFVAAVLGLQFRSMRESVHEEVLAANRVAAQMLNRTAWRYAAQGTPAMLAFLQGMGRVRSNDIQLFDASGQEQAERRVIGFQNVPQFLASLDAAGIRAGTAVAASAAN